MNRLTLNAKLWAALAVMWVLLLALGAWNAFHTKSVMMAERRDGLQSLVATGEGIVKLYAERAAKGTMSKEDAQKAAKDALRAMRFGQNGYLFVVDSKPQVILNPGLPQTEGNVVGEFKDPDGVYVTAPSSTARGAPVARTRAFPRTAAACRAPRTRSAS